MILKNQQISDQLIYFQSYQKFLENNNLLNESQYAYRNNSSTEQTLVNVTEQNYKSIVKGKILLT